MARLDYTNFFVQLERMGLTDSVLPFLLIFAVLFTILERTKVLGRDKKNANLVISIVIALMVVLPHLTGGYPKGQDPIEILNAAIPSVSIVLIAIIMLLILAGAFGQELGLQDSSVTFVMIVSIGIIIWIFGNAAGWFNNIPSILDDPAILSTVIVLLTIGIVIAVVAGGGGSSTTTKGAKKFGGFLKGIMKAITK